MHIKKVIWMVGIIVTTLYGCAFLMALMITTVFTGGLEAKEIVSVALVSGIAWLMADSEK